MVGSGRRAGARGPVPAARCPVPGARVPVVCVSVDVPGRVCVLSPWAVRRNEIGLSGAGAFSEDVFVHFYPPSLPRLALPEQEMAGSGPFEINIEIPGDNVEALKAFPCLADLLCTAFFVFISTSIIILSIGIFFWAIVYVFCDALMKEMPGDWCVLYDELI